MRKDPKLTWMALLAVLASLAWGCGRGTETGGEQSPGITDEEIKLGGSYPFSGPASAYRVIADGARAYFEEVNEAGGVDGRKITFVTLDDGYEPARANQNARRLVEEEEVFALFNTLGTANNLAMWDYVNEREVPHLFLATGATNWGEDVESHRYTIGFQPDYATESTIYAEYLQETRPDAKVAVLYQNDEYGESLLSAFEEAIEGSGVDVVARESYEATDPTVASQVRNLAGSGADTFLDISTPKFAVQAITEVARSGWEPLHILNSVSASKAAVLEPAGLESSRGIISAIYYKYPDDPQWADDPAMQAYKDALAQHFPEANPDDPDYAYGWAAAATMVEALEQMEEPTREALMDSVRNLHMEIPILLPGIEVQTGEGDGYPIESMQIVEFDGEVWRLQGDVLHAERS